MKDGMIEVGDYFLCIRDVHMINTSEQERVYTAGKIYKSEARECITNDTGYKNHYWELDSEYSPKDDIFGKYFRLINPKKRKYWKILHDQNTNKE